MRSGYFVCPPVPLPDNPGPWSDTAHRYRQIATRAKALAGAQEASERCADQRAMLDAGSSRSRITSANAKWMRAAEDRDRCLRNFVQALEECGFSGENKNA